MSSAALVRPHYLGLFAALAADAGLQAVVGSPARIYRDVAPPNTPLPYLTIGAFSEFDIPAFGSGGSEIPWLIHLWGKSGTAQVMTLWEHVKRVLSDGVVVAGGAVYYANVDLVDVGPDSEPTVEHGRVRYRAQLEATP